MELREEKRALREEIRRRAAALSPGEIETAGRKLEARILSSPLFREAGSVFLYLSVGTEPPTSALLSACFEGGKRVYVPKCLPRRGDVPPRMLALPLSPGDPLIRSAYGIPEPLYDPDSPPAAAAFDLIIVPCVTVSLSGERLGHGAGFYDRFFHEAEKGILGNNALPSVKLCPCIRALLSDSVPTGGHDVRMDYVATEDGIFPCR